MMSALNATKQNVAKIVPENMSDSLDGNQLIFNHLLFWPVGAGPGVAGRLPRFMGHFKPGARQFIRKLLKWHIKKIAHIIGHCAHFYGHNARRYRKNLTQNLLASEF
jgi:hypothetical protein